MHWILPALTAPFINAIVNFCDKYLVAHRISDTRAMPIYTAMVSFFAGTAVWLVSGHPITGWNVLLGVASGVFYFLAVIAYYYLMSRRDASDTVIISGFTPVITLALSFLFLGERITLLQFIGFWIILAAVLAISVKPSAGLKMDAKISLMALVMDLCWATSTIFIKFSMVEGSFPLSLACEAWGLGIGGIVLFTLSPAIRQALRNNVLTTCAETFLMVGLNELLSVFAVWIGFYAYSMGPIALVSIAGGAQSFFAVIIGYLLTIFAPAVVNEDISNGNILKKILAVFGLAAGLCMIYF